MLTIIGVILALLMLTAMAWVAISEFLRCERFADRRRERVVRSEDIDPGCPGCGGVYGCACPLPEPWNDPALERGHQGV